MFLVTRLARQGFFTSLLGRVLREEERSMTSSAKLWAGTAQCYFLWTFLAQTSLQVSLFCSPPLHLVGEGGISEVDYCQTHDIWDWTNEIGSSLLITYIHVPEGGDHTVAVLEDRRNKQELWEARVILQPGGEMKPIKFNIGWSAAGLADGRRSWVDSIFLLGGRHTWWGQRNSWLGLWVPVRCEDVTAALTTAC